MKFTKSKKVKKINTKTLVVALDIGKNVHYGYFRTPDNKEYKPFPFYNTINSFNDFWDKLLAFKTKHKLNNVVIGFESTGPYAEPMVNYLRNKPVELVQVNPLHTKRVKELTGNSPNKTDKKDPRVIADVISLGHSLTVIVPEGSAAELRRLTHARERSISRRTAMLNQLQHLVFIIFPELLTLFKASTKTGQYLMKNYPDPESIVALGVESLCTITKRMSRGRFGRHHTEKLFKAAQESAGVTEGKESIALEIKQLIYSIENENSFIKGLEEQMVEHLKQIPYSQSILSIKGIGQTTAAGLIGEVGDFSKFKTISEIMKLAGLDLFEVSSGAHKGRHHISKRGRSLIRKLLFFAAINAVKSNGIMHIKYQKMLDNGTPKIKALIAISRKLLRIIFALARDNVEYDASYNMNDKLKMVA